jgi:hypothetical protein
LKKLLFYNDDVRASIRERFSELILFLFVYLTEEEDDECGRDILWILSDLSAVEDVANAFDAYWGNLFVFMFKVSSLCLKNIDDLDVLRMAMAQVKGCLLICNNINTENVHTENFRMQYCLAAKKGLLDIVITLHRKLSSLPNDADALSHDDKEMFFIESGMFVRQYLIYFLKHNNNDALKYTQDPYILNHMIKQTADIDPDAYKYLRKFLPQLT